MGFPPPSHAHLNQGVPTRNEELPRPQLRPDDSRNVLRKKHASRQPRLAAKRVDINALCYSQSIAYQTAPRTMVSGLCFRGNAGSSFGNRRHRVVGEIQDYRSILRFFGRSVTATSRFQRPARSSLRAQRSNQQITQRSWLLRCYRASHLTIRNPFAFARAMRNEDVKPLDLFAAGGEAHLQFKSIIVCEIRFGSIERDQGGKFGRQTLFDIGRFECRATHGDGAVFGRNGKADRGQRAGRAIGAHAG